MVGDEVGATDGRAEGSDVGPIDGAALGPYVGIKAGIERAEVDMLSAKLAKEQTAQGLRQAVESAFFDARAAKRTFEANDQALDAARLAMSNAEARFEAGAISALEYADARTRLDNASLNALRTQYDFVFKTRMLDFYMGRPLSL